MNPRSVDHWSPSAYAQAFGGAVPPPRDVTELEGLMGRVMRVKGPGLPQLLATSGKPLAWVFGPDTLFDALPQRTSGWDFLRQVQGMGRERAAKLRRYVSEGNRWLLFVSTTPNAWPADWGGVWAAVAVHDAEVGDRLAPHVPRFREGWLRTIFEPEELARANATKELTGHPEHMSVRRFLDDEPSLERAALLLMHVFGVNEDFRGDGLMDSGKRELLTLNVPVDRIEPRAWVELDVSPPRATP